MADIVAQAKHDDQNQDGVSGRIKGVYDPSQDSQVVGRFGWKMSTGSVLQQSAGAFAADMGVTNKFATQEPCTDQQVECFARAEEEAHVGDAVDIDELQLAFVEFYARTLAVPQRRGYDVATQTWAANIAQGKALYEEINCSACHAGPYVTGTAHESVLGSPVNLLNLENQNKPIAALSNKLIWPHTDLLLNDMGGECDALVREAEQGLACDADSYTQLTLPTNSTV